MRFRATAVRRRIFYLWLLLTGLALVTLALLDVFKEEAERHLQTPDLPVRTGHRIDTNLDLEIIVESRDPALELGVELHRLKSLQEEQLLTVSPTKRVHHALMSGVRDSTSVSGPPTRSKLEKAPRFVGLKRGSVRVAAVQKYGVNGVGGEKTSGHHRLPEARHPACFGEQYSESLPSASVVICFHDEAWSVLLRTVHSVLGTAPRQHLQEVLLVDDSSQHGHLKTVLSEYVSHLDGVHLIRSTRRLGVGGCRSLGAARAAAEVLVFMDSHCECQKGWLEPLLERVAQERTRVVSPIMDVIDWQNYQYNATQWPVRGVFDWRLDFHWESPPQQREEDPEGAAEPLQSPAIGGEVFAINKHFFQSVGAYDSGMLLRGAEHIELSIRVWSCGGSIEVVPCSRVAHLTGHQLPDDFPEQDLLQRNKVRIADIWMDSYRKIFYRRDTLAHFIRQSEGPDVAERLRLKKSLGCKNFHWFLTTVYPQFYIPQDRPALSGELYSVGTDGCVDYPHEQSLQGGAMTVTTCSGTGSQHCELNSDGELRWGPMASYCMSTEGERAVLSLCPTHSPPSNNLHWSFVKESGQLVHQHTQLCLEAVRGEGGGAEGLLLRQCNLQPRQQWFFEQLVVPKGT